MSETGQSAAVIGGITFAIVAEIWALWCTVVAFTGGRMPIIGYETAGGVGHGLVWLFFIDPLVFTLAYWASAGLIVAVMAPAASGQSYGSTQTQSANRRASVLREYTPGVGTFETSSRGADPTDDLLTWVKCSCDERRVVDAKQVASCKECGVRWRRPLSRNLSWTTCPHCGGERAVVELSAQCAQCGKERIRARKANQGRRSPAR